MPVDFDWLIKAVGAAIIMAFGGFIFRTEKRGAEHNLRLNHLEDQAEIDRRETGEYRKEMRETVKETRDDIKDLIRIVAKTAN